MIFSFRIDFYFILYRELRHNGMFCITAITGGYFFFVVSSDMYFNFCIEHVDKNIEFLYILSLQVH